MANVDFLHRLWALENDERAAYQFLARAETGTTALQRFNNVELMMRQQMAEFAARPQVEDDFVPAFFPYLGTTAIPSAFGCPLEWFEHEDPWAVPLICADPADVYDLPDPAVTDGDLGRVLEYTRVMAGASEALPIRMTDIQGPLDAAALIWCQDNLLMAMYDNPAEVHHLLNKITRLIIAFVQEQQRLVHSLGRPFIPCHTPHIWMPEEAGIALSDDTMSLLSPDLYREFGLPYINQISEAFGGVFLHACGNFTHNLGNLEGVHNLRGLDFAASEMPFAAVAETLGGKVVLSVRLGLNRDIPFASIPAFVDHVLAHKRTNRGLFFVINMWYDLAGSGEAPQMTDAESIAARIKQAT